MKFGDRIKRRRMELHMSAGELGSLIGKNRATVYRYESGDIENVPLEVLDPLADALDTTPEYLMGWTNTEHIETRIKKDGKEIVFKGVDSIYIRHFTQWYDVFMGEPFTEEEYVKLLEYGKFLMYLRGK